MLLGSCCHVGVERGLHAFAGACCGIVHVVARCAQHNHLFCHAPHSLPSFCFFCQWQLVAKALVHPCPTTATSQLASLTSHPLVRPIAQFSHLDSHQCIYNIPPSPPCHVLAPTRHTLTINQHGDPGAQPLCSQGVHNHVDDLAPRIHAHNTTGVVWTLHGRPRLCHTLSPSLLSSHWSH